MHETRSVVFLNFDRRSNHIGGGGGGGRERERERERERRKSLFDWPVAFTKVILIVANCTLAKCSEEHVNHKK